MSREWIALVLAVFAAVCGGIWAWRVLMYGHRRRIGVERATGNLRLRSRMERNAGLRFQPEVQQTVTRAETMWGWVWILSVRRRGVFREDIGWSPFRWSARRALARRQG